MLAANYKHVGSYLQAKLAANYMPRWQLRFTKVLYYGWHTRILLYTFEGGWWWCGVDCCEYSMTEYSVVEYSVVEYIVVEYSVVKDSMVQYSVSVVQYSVVQYNVLQCSFGVQCLPWW